MITISVPKSLSGRPVRFESPVVMAHSPIGADHGPHAYVDITRVFFRLSSRPRRVRRPNVLSSDHLRLFIRREHLESAHYRAHSSITDHDHRATLRLIRDHLSRVEGNYQ